MGGGGRGGWKEEEGVTISGKAPLLCRQVSPNPVKKKKKMSIDINIHVTVGGINYYLTVNARVLV